MSAVAGVGLAATLGCNAIAGIDDLYPNASSVAAIAVSSSAMGSGGAGGVSVAASSASASAGGAGGAGGSAPLGCVAQYGHVPFFQLCSETPDVCSFYAHIEPQTCSDLCASGGGECFQVYNNFQDMPGCMLDNMVSCLEATLMDAICVCSFGCGSGPPCLVPQTCKQGMCV